MIPVRKEAPKPQKNTPVAQDMGFEIMCTPLITRKQNWFYSIFSKYL